MGTLSRWITAIGAAFKRPSEDALRPTIPPSHVPDESGVEGAVAEDAMVEVQAAATVEAEDEAPATVEADDRAAAVEAEDEVRATVEADDKAAATVAAEDVGVATVAVEDVATIAVEEVATVAVEDKAAATVEVEDEAVPADLEVRQETQVTALSNGSPDRQEIQRRRELVRVLFNDFWKGSDEKPVTFADRLNQAEAYLNERLNERGEAWQLDAATRKMLGLPPRAN